MGLEAPFLILVSAAACFWFGTVIGKHYLLSRVATLMALALWAGGLILSLVALAILVHYSSVPSSPPQVPQQPPHGGNSDQEAYQDAEQEVGHVFISGPVNLRERSLDTS